MCGPKYVIHDQTLVAKKTCFIPEVLDNGEVTDGAHVTAGQLALALTPYAQVADLAVNEATPARTEGH